MMYLAVSVVYVSTVALLVAGSPYKVPSSACVSMTPSGPGHKYADAQNSEVPFDFELSSNTILNSGSVEFSIKQQTPGGPEFLGFMVQVRPQSVTIPVGTFQSDDKNFRAVTCTHENDTASHKSPEAKSSVSMTWTPPRDFTGPVDFYVTVVKDRSTFWAHEKVASLTVNQGPQ